MAYLKQSRDSRKFAVSDLHQDDEDHQKQSRDSRKRARTVKVVLHKGVTQEAIKR